MTKNLVKSNYTRTAIKNYPTAPEIIKSPVQGTVQGGRVPMHRDKNRLGPQGGGGYVL